MRHIPPREILKLKRQLIVERPRLLMPGLMPIPKIIGAAREVSPGSQAWTTPGTYNWTVPNFNTLTVTVKGAGGGGSGAGYAQFYYLYPLTGSSGTAGANGGTSQFGSSLIANGGLGGPGGSAWNTSSPMTPGANGTGFGGDQNYTGTGSPAGGYGSTTSIAFSGLYVYVSYGGNGGVGGRTIKTYTEGMLTPNQSVQIIVGVGGYHGADGGYTPGYQYWQPASGQPGSVEVSWS